MMYAKGRSTVAGHFSGLCFAIFSAGSTILLAQPTAILPAEIPLDVAAIYQPLEPAASYGDTTEDIIDQIVAGLRSACTYAGASSIEEFHERAVVGVQSSAGYDEGRPLGTRW
jgi:hypothetical protein